MAKFKIGDKVVPRKDVNIGGYGNKSAYDSYREHYRIHHSTVVPEYFIVTNVLHEEGGREYFNYKGVRCDIYGSSECFELYQSPTIIVKGGKYINLNSSNPKTCYHECIAILEDGSAIFQFNNELKRKASRVLLISPNQFNEWVEWTEPKPEPVIHKAYIHWIKYPNDDKIYCSAMSCKRETGWSGNLLKIEEVTYTEGESK